MSAPDSKNQLGEADSKAKIPAARGSRFKLPAALRRWLRSLHRDAGYLAVGLTFVYAISGIAVNHIADWDPNFTQVAETHQLSPAIPSSVDPSDAVATRRLGEHIVSVLKFKIRPTDVYAVSESELDITLETGSTIHVELGARTAEFQGQKPRLLLRVANWLHTNRGKKAWTYVADTYAALLLYLATSGILLLPVTRGFLDRKWWLVLGGALTPIIYVAASGGP